MTIGETIKDLRKKEHFTVQTLSILSGLSERFINYLEHDKKKPSYRSLTKIADACDRNMVIKYTGSQKITSVYFPIRADKRVKDFDEKIAELRDRLFNDCMVKLCHFNKEKADEITQEAIYRALVYSHRYNSSSQLYTWLYSIAQNVFYNSKKEKKTVELIEDYIDLGIEIDTFEMKPIINAVNSLSSRQKELFKLKTIGYTYKEIGERLGTKAISAKSKYFKIKKQLTNL